MSKNWKKRLADVEEGTIAFLIYKGGTALIGIVFEMGVMGFSLKQWLGIRVLNNVILFGLSVVLPKLTDKTRKGLSVKTEKLSLWQILKQAVADGVTLMVVQVPVYTVVAVLVGATQQQILGVVKLYTLDAFATGWLYGWILNWVRRISKSTKDSIEQ